MWVTEHCKHISSISEGEKQVHKYDAFETSETIFVTVTFAVEVAWATD